MREIRSGDFVLYEFEIWLLTDKKPDEDSLALATDHVVTRVNGPVFPLSLRGISVSLRFHDVWRRLRTQPDARRLLDMQAVHGHLVKLWLQAIRTEGTYIVCLEDFEQQVMKYLTDVRSVAVQGCPIFGGAHGNG